MGQVLYITWVFGASSLYNLGVWTKFPITWVFGPDSLKLCCLGQGPYKLGVWSRFLLTWLSKIMENKKKVVRIEEKYHHNSAIKYMCSVLCLNNFFCLVNFYLWQLKSLVIHVIKTESFLINKLILQIIFMYTQDIKYLLFIYWKVHKI